MICALTVRKLKPGTFDDFKAAFMRDFDRGNPPEGWVRFSMVRKADDPDEVITFGFFTGTVEQLRAPEFRSQYEDQMREIAQYVENTGADGFYDVVEDLSAASAAA
jgi:hypothetical protein